MQLPSMGAAYRNAFLQAPRPADTPEQSPSHGMLDGRGLGRRAHGLDIGRPALGGLNLLPRSAREDEKGSTPRGFDLSPQARRFRALGVEPGDLELQVRHDEVKFKLSMEDESLRVGTRGNIDYSSSRMDLEINMSTTEGVALVDGREVRFKQYSFSLDFSWESLEARTGTRQDAFAAKKDDFMEAVMEKVREMSDMAMTDGNLSDAIDALGKSLGERLFSMAQGVMEVGALAPERAVYGPPKPPSGPRPAGSEAMREIQRTAQLLREANEKAALLGASRTSPLSPPSTSHLDRSA